MNAVIMIMIIIIISIIIFMIIIIMIIIIMIIIIIITSETGKQYYNYSLIISNTPLIKLEPVFHKF